MSQGLGRLFFGLIMPIVLTYMFLGPTAVEILRPPVRDILPPPNSIFPSNSYGAVPSERSTVFIVVPNADGLSGEAPCTPGSSTKAQVLLGVAQQLQEKLSDVGVEAFIVAAEGQNARGQYFLQSRQADVCLVLGAGDCAKPSGFCICSGRDKASAESERLVRAITASYARATANKIAPATQCQCSRDLARAVALDPTNGVPASTPGVAVELGSMGADIFVLESQSGGAILAQGLAEGVLSFLVEGNRLQPPWPYSGDLVRDEQEHVIGSQDVYQQEAPRGPMQSRGSAIRPSPR